MRLSNKYGGLQFFAPGVQSYTIKESESGATVMFVSADFETAVTFAGNVLTITGSGFELEQINSEYVESYTEGFVNNATIIMKRQIIAYDDTMRTITFEGGGNHNE